MTIYTIYRHKSDTTQDRTTIKSNDTYYLNK